MHCANAFFGKRSTRFAWRLGWGFCAGLAVLFCVAEPLVAAPILYGNLTGSTVVYQQIREDSTTDPGVPLFGAPGLIGDSLTFNPPSFGINAVNGGFDYMDGTLSASLNSIGQSRIEKIVFQECGDYTLAGSGTTATNVAVSCSLFIRVTMVDDGPIVPYAESFSLTFTPSAGTFDLVNDPGMTIAWSGSVEIDIDAMLARGGITGKATKLDLVLDNALLAFSEQGTIAYIKKKQAEGITITAIPEPATLSLLGLGAVAILRKRK